MKRAAVVLLAASVAACASNPAPQAAGAGSTRVPSEALDHRTAVHVLNRMSFGARAADVEALRAQGLRAYVDAQLADGADDGGLAARLAPLDMLTVEPRSFAEEYTAPMVAARRANTGTPPSQLPEVRRYRQLNNQILQQMTAQKLLRAVYSERQLVEVLTDFWFNHFNVDARKVSVRPLLVAFERDAIRPHVFGRFRDLLRATAKSPAMLFYLDNRASRAGRLNENYARELMELHTVGVDAGYTQQDVVEVARAFTGWTVEGAAAGSGFMFRPRLHDRGEKHVLGHTLPAGRGIEDGEEVLDILAEHPATARFIATKLARRFVADDPPPALVDRGAAAFTRTGGDLREVVRVILLSPEFLSPAAYRAKVKTPFELVASALRATGAEVANTAPAVRAVALLGEPLYQCQPPTGYGDRAADWLNTGALVARMNFARDLAAAKIKGIARRPANEADEIERSTIAALGGDLSDATRDAVEAQASAADRVAVLLASPEFQRR